MVINGQSMGVIVPYLAGAIIKNVKKILSFIKKSCRFLTNYRKYFSILKKNGKLFLI